MCSSCLIRDPTSNQTFIVCMYHLLVDSLICARIRIASFQLPGQSPHAQPQGRGGRETKTFKHNTCVGRLTRKVDGVTGIFMCRIVQRTHRVTQCRHCTIMFGVLDLIDYRPGFVAFIRCLCVNGQMGSFPLKIVVALTRRKNKLNREKTKNKFVWRVCRVWESDNLLEKFYCCCHKCVLSVEHQQSLSANHRPCNLDMLWNLDSGSDLATDMWWYSFYSYI